MRLGITFSDLERLRIDGVSSSSLLTAVSGYLALSLMPQLVCVSIRSDIITVCLCIFCQFKRMNSAAMWLFGIWFTDFQHLQKGAEGQAEASGFRILLIFTYNTLSTLLD